MLGLIAVKGKSIPVGVYELVARCEEASPEVIQEIAAYNQAMSAYLQKQFALAKGVFLNYLNHHPGDLAAGMHLGFCTQYLDNPPTDAAWTGVLKMTEK
jgi:adenylate cyclase